MMASVSKFQKGIQRRFSDAVSLDHAIELLSFDMKCEEKYFEMVQQKKSINPSSYKTLLKRRATCPAIFSSEAYKRLSRANALRQHASSSMDAAQRKKSLILEDIEDAINLLHRGLSDDGWIVTEDNEQCGKKSNTPMTMAAPASSEFLRVLNDIE